MAARTGLLRRICRRRAGSNRCTRLSSNYAGSPTRGGEVRLQLPPDAFGAAPIYPTRVEWRLATWRLNQPRALRLAVKLHKYQARTASALYVMVIRRRCGGAYGAALVTPRPRGMARTRRSMRTSIEINSLLKKRI